MLYPAPVLHASGLLDADQGHRIYWEESGNPSGRPVLLLHGGPGAPAGAGARRWFDGRTCRIITFDQRGTGRSSPLASVVANTTRHLLSDIERLRRHVGVDRWVVWGHSWGATLALAYAQSFGDRVAGLVLSATFTATTLEFEWLYGGVAGSEFPVQWREFVETVDDAPPKTIVERYLHALLHGDDERQSAAAAAWCAWEDTLAGVPARAQKPSASASRSRAVLGAHFANHRAFLDDGEIVDRLSELPYVPVRIVHGACDLVSLPRASTVVASGCANAQLRLVDDAGHDPSHPAFMTALIDAGDAVIAEAR
ncbi:MAG TPA: alpha/beta fold hydrolase [Vicinamibacterales bacterium]